VSNAIRVRPSPGVAKRFPWRVIIFFLVIAAIAGVVFLVIPMLSATRRPVVDSNILSELLSETEVSVQPTSAVPTLAAPVVLPTAAVVVVPTAVPTPESSGPKGLPPSANELPTAVATVAARASFDWEGAWKQVFPPLLKKDELRVQSLEQEGPLATWVAKAIRWFINFFGVATAAYIAAFAAVALIAAILGRFVLKKVVKSGLYGILIMLVYKALALIGVPPDKVISAMWSVLTKASNPQEFKALFDEQTYLTKIFSGVVVLVFVGGVWYLVGLELSKIWGSTSGVRTKVSTAYKKVKGTVTRRNAMIFLAISMVAAVILFVVGEAWKTNPVLAIAYTFVLIGGGFGFFLAFDVYGEDLAKAFDAWANDVWYGLKLGKTIFALFLFFISAALALAVIVPAAFAVLGFSNFALFGPWLAKILAQATSPLKYVSFVAEAVLIGYTVTRRMVGDTRSASRSTRTADDARVASRLMRSRQGRNPGQYSMPTPPPASSDLDNLYKSIPDLNRMLRDGEITREEYLALLENLGSG